MDAIRLALHDASAGQIDIERTGTQLRNRTGYDLQFYLGVEFVSPIDLGKLKCRRFQANFTINDRYHPIFVFVHSPTSVELEKWDDREILPEDDDYVTIVLEGTEGF